MILIVVISNDKEEWHEDPISMLESSSNSHIYVDLSHYFLGIEIILDTKFSSTLDEHIKKR
jgi:hypothetical protein